MIKDLINELETELSNIQLDSEKKQSIISKIATVKTETELVLNDLKRTTDQSVGRKQKLGQLSNTILDLQSKNRQLDVLKLQNQKLSKYRQNSINQKKTEVTKIKSFLQNVGKESKNYSKYQTVLSSLNFDDLNNQSILDENLKVIKHAKDFGVFDGDKGFNINTLPKPKVDGTILTDRKSFL